MRTNTELTLIGLAAV
jgi:hypothetical protein